MVDGDLVGGRREFRRRATPLVGALAALLCAPLVPAAGAASACWAGAPVDVDGGGPDVVLGLPSFDLPGKRDAGAVVVFSDLAGPGEPLPGGAPRGTLVTAADVGLPTQAGARFGAAVVVVRRSDQPCADVLVGAPGEDVAGRRGAGRVHWLPGGAGRLGPPLESLDEDVLGAPGGAQAGAGFGSAVAADGSDWLAVGVPRRDVAGALDAGRVIRVDRRLLGRERADVVQQGGTGAGGPEQGDRFGEVLEVAPGGAGPLLLVGVPHEDVGTRVDAGAVALAVEGRPLTMVTQDSRGAGGAAEAGDRFGAALDSWGTFVVDHPVVMAAVGVPGEDVGRAADAGLVGYVAVDLVEDPLVADALVAGPLRGLPRTVSQDAPGVPGVVEPGDRFGSAVLTAEIGTGGRLQLVVGAPGEDLGSTADAGLVTSTRVDAVTGATVGGSGVDWTQDSPGVTGRPERGDRFGSALAATALAHPPDDEDPVRVVLTTVPGEDDGTTPDTGLGHLGLPGASAVPLIPPVLQAEAGDGLVAPQLPRS